MTRRGNTIGFTAQGEPICGRYAKAMKAWQVYIQGACGPKDTRNFAKKDEAEAYASTLVDMQKTQEQRWW